MQSLLSTCSVQKLKQFLRVSSFSTILTFPAFSHFFTRFSAKPDYIDSPSLTFIFNSICCFTFKYLVFISVIYPKGHFVLLSPPQILLLLLPLPIITFSVLCLSKPTMDSTKSECFKKELIRLSLILD